MGDHGGTTWSGTLKTEKEAWSLFVSTCWGHVSKMCAIFTARKCMLIVNVKYDICKNLENYAHL